jgi:FkbM family methyltransferase
MSANRLPETIPFSPKLHRNPAALVARRLTRFVEQRLAPPRMNRPRLVKLGLDVTLEVIPIDMVELSMLINGVHEFTVTNAFLSLLSPGMIVIDCGAHIGQFTILSSRVVGTQGLVVAIEPIASTHTRLVSNVEANTCTNIRVINTAVSDRPGENTMYLPHDPTASMATMDRGRYDAEPIAARVQTTTLDQLIGSLSLRTVDVIKLDIEGHEASALVGATQLLEQHHPSVMVEINDIDTQGHSQTVQLLRDHGYNIYDIWRWRLTKLERGDDIARSLPHLPALNLIAIHPASYRATMNLD